MEFLVSLDSQPRKSLKSQRKQDWIRGDPEWLPNYIRPHQTAYMALVAFAPEIVEQTVRMPPASVATLIGVVPGVSSGASIVVPTVALVPVTAAPVVSGGANVQPASAGVLTLQGVAPALLAGASVLPPRGDMALSGVVPVISAGAQVALPVTNTALQAQVPIVSEDYLYRIIVPVKTVTILATEVPTITAVGGGFDNSGFSIGFN